MGAGSFSRRGKTVGVAGSGPHLLFPVYLPPGEKAAGMINLAFWLCDRALAALTAAYRLRRRR